eukprot:GILJ01008067.1.p1 GENE.GILJ01008067.1~~GILJ01008067.1.p1  ORF type:complete len:263 (-),score=22.11 GILJ01008067.1:58-753(-)
MASQIENGTVPWKHSLERAISLNRQLEFSKYVQLATVDRNNLPACRTVGYRGMVPDSQDSNRCFLQFFTDCRSDKVDDLKHQAVAEVCWYFPLSRDQFRLRGEVKILSGESSTHAAYDELRRSAWQQMNETSRQLYEAQTPGTPCPDRADHNDLESYEPQPLDADKPSANFVVLLLSPTHVDHLILPPPPVVATNRAQHHESILQPAKKIQRWRHDLNPSSNTWSTKKINP